MGIEEGLRNEAGPRTVSDECPSAIAAVEAIVARLGPIVRIRIDPGFFDCGDLWPGVGSPVTCAEPAIFPGSAMHGWASFHGTGRVAAISLYRSPIDPNSVGPPFGSWRANLAALHVPPAGWVMP